MNAAYGEVLALALHLGVFGAGLHPDGAGCLKHLKVAIMIILNNLERPLLMPFFQ